jgi:phage shock protein C
METKKLYRSRTDRMIAGVCGGLADFFNIDPTIVRLIFVLLFLTGSAGFWIYIVLLIVVPEAPLGSSDVIDAEVSDEDSQEE